MNGFVGYDFSENFSALLSVNNLFDDFGLSESEEGSIPDNRIIRARGIAGRSTNISFRDRF